jgi:hypothetical protein
MGKKMVFENHHIEAGNSGDSGPFVQGCNKFKAVY